MDEPRLKTHIRVGAHLRRARAGGAFATIARKGDPDAGVVMVKLYLGAGQARLFVQSRDLEGRPVWRDPLGEPGGPPQAESEIDRWLEKERAIDPDLWIVEIEDREGRAFLD